MSNGSSGYKEDIGNWFRGLCMGAADIVPGVSGGTIALILGHYQRLVTAIGNFDRQAIKMLLHRRIRDLLVHTDLRFLIGLAAGIATGVVALASAMRYLLEFQQAYIYAVFFGLILGSSYIVARRLQSWKWIYAPIGLLGAALAWQICLLNPMHGDLTPLNAFLAATVAICAMILPGISGAFILLLLGLYHPITDLIKGLPHGEFDLAGLLVLAAFGGGCMVGLLAFSRFLKWMLAHHHDSTMAFLVGLMIGSLYKIWPFQRVTEATAELPFKERQFEFIWPTESSTSWGWVLGLTLCALAATLLLERLGNRLSTNVEEGEATVKNK